MNIDKKLRSLKLIKPSTLKKLYGTPDDVIFASIKNNWSNFRRPRFFNGSIQTDYSQEKGFYEVCDTRFKRGNYCNKDEFISVLKAQNKNPLPDQHMSAYTHCYRWKKHVNRTGGVRGAKNTKISTPYIWIELDRESLEQAMADAWMIATNFSHKEHMRFWYSGNSSIHIGVDARLFGSPVGWSKDVGGRGKLFYNIAEKICGDLRWHNGYSDPYFLTRSEVHEAYEETFSETIPDDEGEFLKARQRLENFDPSLYGLNSLIRLPFSLHEKTMKPKIEVSLEGLSRYELEPTKRTVKKKVIPHLIEWTFECFEPKERPVTKKKFKTDSGMVRGVYSKYVEDFYDREPNSDGFITGLFNPMYEDTRPSCSVNMNTGELHDFGAGITYDLPEFLGKMKGIGRKKAKSIIRKEDYDSI